MSNKPEIGKCCSYELTLDSVGFAAPRVGLLTKQASPINAMWIIKLPDGTISKPQSKIITVFKNTATLYKLLYLWG